MYDNWKSSKGTMIPSNYTTSPYNESYNNDSWVNSKYFGFISSRIYAGTLNNLTVNYSKEYKFVKGSWSSMTNNCSNGFINNYAASTYSTKFLANYISRSLSNKFIFANNNNICL